MKHFTEKILMKLILFKTPIRGELTVVISEKNIKDKILDEDKIIKKARFI